MALNARGWKRGCAWIVAGAVWLTARPALADEAQVIARCGDAAIRRSELEAAVRRIGAAGLAAGPQRQRVEATILEQLIDERLLRGELERLGLGATEAEIEAAVTRLRDQIRGRGLEFEAFLAGSGRTADELKEQVALEVGLEKFVRPRITAAAVGEAYERNRRELDGTRLRVSHVVLRPEAGGEGDLVAALLERAASVRTEIVQGKLSFEAAARQHSAGPSRRQGGDLGWIGRDGPMLEAFGSQAYRLAKGSVSPPFVTNFGVHILTVTGVEQGRLGIDAVRPRLEKMVAAQLVGGLVAAGRERNPVTFTEGVAHLDPATLGRPADERPVVGGPD